MMLAGKLIPPRKSLDPPDLRVGGFFSSRFHLRALQQLRRIFSFVFRSEIVRCRINIFELCARKKDFPRGIFIGHAYATKTGYDAQERGRTREA